MNVLGDYAKGEPRSVVVLDNASVHHSEYVVHVITTAGAKVIYTAPYSPDLNPIELMFGQNKASLKRVKEKTAEKQQKKTIARGDDCGR